MDLNEALDLHRNHVWQPFTQMKLAHDPLIIERAAGVYLYTKDGLEIIDAVGSWWVNIHGHNHPYINEALIEQLKSFEHVMYAGFNHEPALKLSEALSETTGGNLPRVFFSDNGSTAVEIGMKMAYQYFANTGRPEKQKFMNLQNGYHGDTIGTMSVGSRSVFHKVYESLLFDILTAEMPQRFPFEIAEESNALVVQYLGKLEALLQKHADSVCALILEPMIQGAGGMKMHPPDFLRGIRKLCDTYDVFLIADEVFTGCGRTGEFYACQKAGIWPDIMALSKGLSAGYLPFAATLASEKVYEGFYSDDRMHTLFHGHSMTGNPSGCIASLASLELYEKEGCYDKVNQIEQIHKKKLDQLKAGPLGEFILETRYMGSVAAVEFKPSDEKSSGYTGMFAPEMLKRSSNKGVLIRPLANVAYITPPFCITEQQLDQVYSVLEESALEILS